MVAPADNTRRIKALAQVLGELVEAHRGLLNVVEDKISAMRAADTERLRQHVSKEEALLNRITDREFLRRRLTQDISRGFGISAEVAGRMSVNKLADRVGGTFGPSLNELGGELKSLATKITQRNHVAMAVSETVLRHVKHVLNAMTVPSECTSGYSAGGGVRTIGTSRILDAVG